MGEKNSFKSKLMSVVLIFFMFTTFPLFCSENAEIQLVDKIFTLAKSSDFAKNKTSQEFVTSQFDFATMSKNILGAEFTKQNQKEIEWFNDHIKQIITKTIYPKATDFLKNVNVEHELISKKDKTFSVLTIVKKRGEESEVLSSFSNSSNAWKIIDISIDDESWTSNIKEQVKKKIDKEKWIGLKKSLTKRLEELNSEKK
ncbi:MAG: ABC transporter substrate-binding protein [Halobacteriovoraceae bacterium]|nr:ABC transporter substrate-binding protein [Halobacteriovoraceae bacterium]